MSLGHNEEGGFDGDEPLASRLLGSPLVEILIRILIEEDLAGYTALSQVIKMCAKEETG